MTQPGASPERREWPWLGKLGFRFLWAYLILAGLGFPLGWLPFGVTRAFGQWYLDGTNALSRWTQIHLLGVESPLPFGFSGSSDTMGRYAGQLGLLILAAAITVAWTLLDRRRANYSRLSEWLRVWLRFNVATIIFGYGFAKLIQTQFWVPSLERYVQPLGEFSPMGLLWTFMGHSAPYNVFSGLAEVLGGLLLLFRRTATLGALILIAVMSNVVMLNFSYDVPVKLGSFHLLLMVVVLAAPDFRRLTDLLVLNRPAAARPLRPLFATRRARYLAIAAAALFMGYIIQSDVVGDRATAREFAAKPALYGIYEVEDFRSNNVVRPPLLSDSLRWRQVIFAARNRVTLRTMSDSVRLYSFKVDTVQHSVTFSIRSAPERTLRLSFEQLDPDHLILRGVVDGDSVHTRLRRIDESKYLLLSRGFHWVQEQAFNR